MSLPDRKQNRLENYDYNQNGAYFITICVKERKRILCDIVGDDAHIVPKKYGTIVEKYIRSVSETEQHIGCSLRGIFLRKFTTLICYGVCGFKHIFGKNSVTLCRVIN